MTTAPKRLLLATLLAATGVVAIAQPAAPAAPATPAAKAAPAAGEANAQPAKRHERRHPAERHQRLQERIAKHQAALKTALQLTPAQEAAWTTYTASMQPPARAERPRYDRAEFTKLTTPQRIDLMEKHAAERQAHMKQRGDAIKAFYAQLTPEQQKVFDERAFTHGKRDGKRGPGPRGHHEGHRHGGHGAAPGVAPAAPASAAR